MARGLCSLTAISRLTPAAGNPAECSTKPDESKNADIVRVAQMCKTRGFAATILSRDVVKAQLERDLARVLDAAACETR